MDGAKATRWREASDRQHKIRMYPSGKCVNPLDMNPDDINIVDIAHHLSNECRWAGGCPQHYSVAQHSVLVSRQFSTPEMKLAGLLHDAAEAYLKDLPSPIKHDSRMTFYREADEALSAMIFKCYGLPPELIVLTKEVDNLLCMQERRSWWELEPFDGKIVAWSQSRARTAFLEQFDECMRVIHA